MFSLSRQSLTYVFVIIAVVIAVLSLVLSGKLAKKLAEEERAKIEIWASATEWMATDKESADMSLVLRILQSNTTIPVILYDETTGELSSHNIALPEKDTQAFLRKKADKFLKRHEPIRLEELNQALYYDDSYTLKQLLVYPYIQLLVIAVFIALAFFALNSSLKAEQNKVWVGLSKETAHQLGTPISSLLAWSEYLKLKNIDPALLTEIDKDMARLQMIVERFSKIGSASDIKTVDVREAVRETLSYLEKRISGRVEICTEFPDTPALAKLNESLFGWVIENLTKNAVDAMSGQGVITYTIFEKGKHIILDVSDTGKGIPKSNFKTVFSPGFTTKERGWGLGLSLVKRIMEVYHKGRIFVKKSEMGKGTTFRVVLRK